MHTSWTFSPSPLTLCDAQIWYPKNACCTTCPDAYTPPQNEYGILCECPAGTRRDDSGNCTSCDVGQFYPGGQHYDEDNWRQPQWNTTVKVSKFSWRVGGGEGV